MPSRHQKRDLLSPQETQLNRWLSSQFDPTQYGVNQLINQNLLPPAINIQIPQTIGNTITKVFSGLTLSALVDDWPGYCRDFLPGIWDVAPSQMETRRGMKASWPSAHGSVFHWNNGEPRWGESSANPYSKILVRPSNTNGQNQQQIRYHRQRRFQDPAAAEFFRIIDSCTEQEDLVEQLMSAYPPIDWWSEFDERRHTVWSQSIDFVIGRQNNWSRLLRLDTMENSNHLTAIAPLCAFEYDGMTGFRVVNGTVEWSSDAVGSSWDVRRPLDAAYRAGEVRSERVLHRLRKLNDKIDILRDIGVPSTILPYDSLRVFTAPWGSFMAADLSIHYLVASSRYTNPREECYGHYDNPEDLWSILAPQMHLGQFYSQLCQPQFSGAGGVTIERVEDATISPELVAQENDSNIGQFEVSIVQPHLLEGRMSRYRRNPGNFFRNMGVDPQRCIGIRVSINHPRHGEMGVSLPLNPLFFSGSTICPENDHVMLAGWASQELIHQINVRDQENAS